MAEYAGRDLRQGLEDSDDLDNCELLISFILPTDITSTIPPLLLSPFLYLTPWTATDCHIVAGLVGDGLTRLFQASGLEDFSSVRDSCGVFSLAPNGTASRSEEMLQVRLVPTLLFSAFSFLPALPNSSLLCLPYPLSPTSLSPPLSHLTRRGGAVSPATWACSSRRRTF